MDYFMILLLPILTRLTPMNIQMSSRMRVKKLEKIPTPPGLAYPRILMMSASPPSRAPSCMGKKKSRLPISEENANTRIGYKTALRWILPVCGLCAIAVLLWQCWVIIHNPADSAGLRGLIDPLIMVAAFGFIYLKVKQEKKEEKK